jgi:ABC-type uncharacterized transport system involved in gliding motility auxiliary subunit
METKNIIKYAIIGLIAFVFIGLISSVISTSNEEVDLRNRFKQKMDERTAFYDKMWKTLSQKSQIAIKNDSSFARNVDAIMAGRKDAGQLFMKWVQESNPNANYEAVSSLYADLSRAVEGQRDGFFMQEKMIQDIVLAHDNIMTKFPSGFILSSFMGRTRLVYKPITSDRTDEVIKTGKDNNVDLF